MSAALTLYNIEEHLQALLDSEAMVESPEQTEEIRKEIQAAIAQSVDKRERVGQFMAHCEHQLTNIDSEIERLNRLKSVYVNAEARMKEYVKMTILALGADAKGKYRHLEGKTCKFFVRRNPASVEVVDESAVPSQYKTLTLKVPAETWERLTFSIPEDELREFLAQVRKTECDVSLSAVKRDIEGLVSNWEAQGEKELAENAKSTAVPGARLRDGNYSLQRK